MDAGGCHRAIIKTEDETVRIGGENLLHGPCKNILVKYRQPQNLAARLPQTIPADVPCIAHSLVNFAVAKPMLLQAVMPVGFGHALDEVCATSSADDFCRETTRLYNAMCRRVELIVRLDLLLYLLECLTVNDRFVIIGDKVARKLPRVLENFVRPRIFRKIPLKDDIADINGILQNIVDERYRTGMSVLLEPFGSMTEWDIL